ncbi:MAG: hypothetical protein ACOYBP_05300 [Microbacteriaceae bacterium]
MASETLNPGSSILVVCTGNICRSPLAAGLVSSYVSDIPGQLLVTSAGTRPMLGSRVPGEIVRFAESLQVRLDAHVPRELNAELIHQASLVLTAERAHRAEVVSLVPSASRKTYTLNQFARLSSEHEDMISRGELPALATNQIDELVSEIADFRSLAAHLEQPQRDDIEDPYGRSQTAYEHVNEEIHSVSSHIAQFLRSYLSS